jgi:hypothetical protein
MTGLQEYWAVELNSFTPTAEAPSGWSGLTASRSGGFTTDRRFVANGDSKIAVRMYNGLMKCAYFRVKLERL